MPTACRLARGPGTRSAVASSAQSGARMNQEDRCTSTETQSSATVANQRPRDADPGRRSCSANSAQAPPKISVRPGG